MRISCGKARRILWPEEKPRRVTSDVLLAQQHLAGCAACQRFHREMRDIADRLRADAPRPAAPPMVRERLFSAIARARTDAAPSSPYRRPRSWVAAALLALLAGGVWLAQTTSRQGIASDPAVAFAEDHVRTLKGDGMVSPDSSVISTWLDARLAFSLRFPLFPNSSLRGARLCLMDGRQGAVVEYTVDGEAVSYFVVPESHAPAPERPDGDLRFQREAGYGVILWHEPGLVHALVGRLPESKLTALARFCMKQVLALLSATEAFPVHRVRHTAGL